MDLLKQLGKFFGWLSGVLAAVTAVLYALGFVATTTHQTMLGLGWATISREPLWYLGLGGQVAARWALLAVVALLLLLLVGESVRWTVRRTERPGNEHPGRVAGAARWLDRNLVWFIALLAMVLAGSMMQAFDGALGIRNLLFLSQVQLCASTGVAAALAGADTATLSEHANRIAFYSTLALGTGWYAVPRLVSGSVPAVPLLICIAVALQALGAIPAAHGIFVLDTRMRSVVLESANGDPLAERLRLLDRVRDGVWAWQPDTRRIHWFAEASFDHIEIGEADTIRALACR